MLEDIIKERLKKIDLLKEAGINPYPARTKKVVSINDVIKNFNSLSKNKKRVSVAGRIMSFRDQGNLVFSDLVDSSGKIQIVLKKDNISNLNFWKKVLDRGDFIFANGIIFKTKKGET